MSILAFLMIVAPAFDDTEPLTYVFKAGDEQRYLSTNTRTTKFKKAGKKVEISIEQKTANTWKVLSVSPEGVAEIGQQITRLRIIQKGGPLGVQTIDSSAEDTPEAIKGIFDDLTASEIRYKMKPNGEVSDVELPAKLKERLKSKEAAKSAILTEEGLVRTVKNSTFILPPKALKPNDGWDLPPHTYQEAGHWITVNSRVTFEGVVEKDGRKLLKFVRNPEYTLKKSDEPNQFAEATIKKQQGEMTVYLEPETRRLVESISTESIATETGTGENLTEVETTIESSNRQSKKGPKS